MIEILKSLSKREIILAVLVVCLFLSTFILSIVCVVRSKGEKKIYAKISSLRIDLATVIKNNDEKIDSLDKKIDSINDKLTFSTNDKKSSVKVEKPSTKTDSFDIMSRR